MSDIIASLAAKWHTAKHVAAQPAAHYAEAPLRPSAFKPSPSLPLFGAMRTLDHHGISLIVNPRHSLVFLQLLCPQKLCKLLLSGSLLVCTLVLEERSLLFWDLLLCLVNRNPSPNCLISSVSPEEFVRCFKGGCFWVSFRTFNQFFRCSSVLFLDIGFVEILLIRLFMASLRALCMDLYLSLVNNMLVAGLWERLLNI